MDKRVLAATLVLISALSPVLAAHTQEQSLGDRARQANAQKSGGDRKPTKVITNDDLCAQSGPRRNPSDGNSNTDPDVAEFLGRIAGKWNSSYFRKGNTSWWPDHGMSAPKNKTVYDFEPTGLVIESVPEFTTPSLTDRFVYASVEKVSSELYDIVLQAPCDPSHAEKRRFKLSPDGKTLELATDADKTLEPTVQVLERIGGN